MALHQNDHLSQQHQHQHQNPLFLLDCLFCEEETCEDQEHDHHHQEEEQEDQNHEYSSSFLLENTHFHLEVDDGLDRLFSKEQEHHRNSIVLAQGILSAARVEAVKWMLKVNAHYGFSSLTALLSINYLDRVLSSPHFQVEKPWMVQLVAVTCVSLAAKVEEVHVPLLLDLQVEDSKYIFEAKMIQRMEVLVLTCLQWKMHAVTPVSFLELIIRRLRLKNHIEAEFFRRCERILLSLVSDSRSMGFLPSVLAISTMVSVIEEMGNGNPSELLHRLLNALDINKGRVKECCEVIMEVSKWRNGRREKGNGKRKYELVGGLLGCGEKKQRWW